MKNMNENSGVKNEIAASAVSPRNCAATTLSMNTFTNSAQTDIDAVKSIDLNRRPLNDSLIRISAENIDIPDHPTQA